MRARAVGSSKEEAGHRPRVFPGWPIPTVLYGTVFQNSCRVAHLLQMLTERIGTTRKSLALQRFLPESEGQLTCPGLGREDRS
jgi:hypothetical protein